MSLGSPVSILAGMRKSCVLHLVIREKNSSFLSMSLLHVLPQDYVETRMVYMLCGGGLVIAMAIVGCVATIRQIRRDGELGAFVGWRAMLHGAEKGSARLP